MDGWTPIASPSLLEFRFYGLGAEITLQFYEWTCYTEMVEVLAGTADIRNRREHIGAPSRTGQKSGEVPIWPIRRTTFAVETGIAEAHTAPPISAERPGVKVRASKAHELSLLPSRDGPLRREQRARSWAWPRKQMPESPALRAGPSGGPSPDPVRGTRSEECSACLGA